MNLPKVDASKSGTARLKVAPKVRVEGDWLGLLRSLLR
jgi:hypothetical protein